MSNEREVELPWLYGQVLTFPVLDVGSHESVYLRRYEDAMTPLDGVDVRQQTRGGLREFYQGDIRTWPSPRLYATVIALSTIEHIGLAVENYGTAADDEHGDRAAVLGCMRALRPDGVFLMTVPFGPAENRGWYRIYDADGLSALLEGLDWSAEYHFDKKWAVGGVALCTVKHPA